MNRPSVNWKGDQPLSLRPVWRPWRPSLGLCSAPGDVVVLPADSYYTTRVLAEGYFTQMGVQVRMAPTVGNAQQQALTGAKLLWLESPSNPGLEVCDIAALAAAAHAAGALVAVDNTTPTILGQQPLALGADFSMASDTKALTGHSDLILGHVATREQEWADRLAHMADAARGGPRSDGSVVSASVVGHGGRAPRAPVPQRPGTGNVARQPVRRAVGTLSRFTP